METPKSRARPPEFKEEGAMFKSLFKNVQNILAGKTGFLASGVDAAPVSQPRRKLSNLRPSKSDLDPIEIASRDEIAALQRRRLAATLTLAYENVPHYKAAFDVKGVHPADFKNLEDLRQFPFTSKADLRANYPFGMFAV